ncbi:hypothetical protein [Ancylobacter terrae]|uniref:hypothetical protein n=1 Tax=Ancylobacter sp. sgz301288 TaxID=3342077 RepID=UPI00385EEBDC
MQLIAPQESLPEPGTVANPATLFDGEHLYLCYAASPRSGAGNVVLRFTEIIDFRIAPLTAEGLASCRYPIRPWAFTEVIGSEEAAQWSVLKPRFWLISFNDVTLELLFGSVSLVAHDPRPKSVATTLMDVLRDCDVERLAPG